jgi:hypothetical protein
LAVEHGALPDYNLHESVDDNHIEDDRCEDVEGCLEVLASGGELEDGKFCSLLVDFNFTQY